MSLFRFDVNHDFATPFAEKLGLLHEHINGSTGAIERIACALYDPEAGTLDGLFSSTTEPMRRVPSRVDLSGTSALYRLAQRDTDFLAKVPLGVVPSSAHALSMPTNGKGSAKGSSYSFPLFHKNRFVGFVFFYSRSDALFDASTRSTLPVYAALVGSLISNELKGIETIISAVRLARRFSNLRHIRTDNNIVHMAHYSRLIAERLMDGSTIDYEFIERLFLFAPLHDIGNVAVPDRILLKPGTLSSRETELMRQHVVKGREMTEHIIEDLGLNEVPCISMLRNVVELHHERTDGSGYPYGLHYDQIPLEARIIAVADVFDALISERPYKPARRTDQALEELHALGQKGKLDPQCVAAITGAPAEIDTIQDMLCGVDGVT